MIWARHEVGEFCQWLREERKTCEKERPRKLTEEIEKWKNE